MDGLVDSKHICPECGLDNAPESLALLGKTLRREWFKGRWCALIGAFGAPASFIVMLRLDQHAGSAYPRWQPPWWANTAIITAMCLMTCVCAVGCAILLSARARIVHRRLGVIPAITGTALGILLSTASIGVLYLFVLIGAFH